MIPYSDLQKKTIRAAVRNEMAKNPLMAMETLAQKVSQRLNHPVSRNYVANIVRKVDGSLIQEAASLDLQRDLQKSGEIFRVMKEKLMSIAFWHPNMAADDPSLTFMPFYKDQVNAMKVLAMIEKLGMDIKLDTGMYRRHLGTLELERRNTPLPVEAMDAIGLAFKNWGFKPPVSVKVHEVAAPKNDNGKPTAKNDSAQ